MIMKNDFYVKDGVVHILINRKDGTTLTAKVSERMLPILKELDVRWSASYRKDSDTYYVYAFKWNPKTKKNKCYQLHRLVCGLKEGESHKQVDHINHDGLDNTDGNLRVVNQHQNQLNRKGARKDSTTRHKNIYYTKGKYKVQFKRNGKQFSLGVYPTLDDAIRVRDEYLIKERSEEVILND